MIALPDVARETYLPTIGFPVAKRETRDTEDRLLRLVSDAEPHLRIAAIKAILAARDAPGTLEELSVLLEQGRIEDAILAAGLAGAILIADAYATVYTLSGQKSCEVFGRCAGCGNRFRSGALESRESHAGGAVAVHSRVHGRST